MASRGFDRIVPRLVDQHFRVVLTPEVRRALGVGAGDHVAFILTPEGTVYVRRVTLALG